MYGSFENDKRCRLAAYELALNNGTASININAGFLSTFTRNWKTRKGCRKRDLKMIGEKNLFYEQFLLSLMDNRNSYIHMFSIIITYHYLIKIQVSLHSFNNFIYKYVKVSLTKQCSRTHERCPIRNLVLDIPNYPEDLAGVD